MLKLLEWGSRITLIFKIHTHIWIHQTTQKTPLKFLGDEIMVSEEKHITIEIELSYPRNELRSYLLVIRHDWMVIG